MEKLDNDHQFSTKAIYDIGLVKRALKDNDQKAYEELLKRYREPVYFMLLRMMNNNSDDAEDLTMEAFGKAFVHLDKYSTVCAFSTWLFKIASNNAIDFIRQRRSERGTLSLDKPSSEGSNESLSSFVKGKELNPEESLIKKQNIGSIRSLIETLKPNYREIVELYYIEELSYEEIAQKVNLPLSTVKTRIFRSHDLLLVVARRRKNFKP